MDWKAILTSQLFAPIIQSIILGAVGAAFMVLRKYLATHAKVSALSAVADAFEDAMDAAVKADGSASKNQLAAVAWKTAETHLLTSWPSIEKALGVELSVVLGSHASMAAGTPVTAPGGAVVTMPAPVKIGVLLFALLLPFHALAQTPAGPAGSPPAAAATAPSTTVTVLPPNGSFSHGLLLGGYLLHLRDPASGKAASSAMAGGAGWGFDWGFLPEDFGPVLGGRSVISLGFSALVVAAQDGPSLLIDAAIGPHVCFVGPLLCVMVAPDAIQSYGGNITGWMVADVPKSDWLVAVTLGVNLPGLETR